jgi:hypothetical protein
MHYMTILSIRVRRNVRFGSKAAPSWRNQNVCFYPKSCRDSHRAARRLRVDAVEKGKNEPIEIFAFAPVETGFLQSEGSQ